MGPWLPRERENNFGVRRMLHAGGAPAFLCRGPRPCAAALVRCACRKAAGGACPAPTPKDLPLTREVRLSKKVCSPLGPLCEGAPPAGGGGENCTTARNISGYGKVLSLRPFGAPPSQREVFRQAGPPFDKGGFFFLAHFFIFFALWEHFSIILHKSVAFAVPIIL